jgi:hypothetical protein
VTILDRTIRRFQLAPHNPDADEAVIDLLHLVMLSDRLSSVDERDRIATFVLSRKWPPGHNAEAYAQKSLAASRIVLTDPDDLHRALDSVVARLSGSLHRQYALDLCQEVANLDGVVAPTERALIRYVQGRLTATLEE